MCVHWYLKKYFSVLSYHFFSNFKGCILEELHASFNNMLGMVFKVHQNEVK